MSALLEYLASAIASVLVALIKFYLSIFRPPSAYSAQDRQNHAEFFSRAWIVVKDITIASHDIIDTNAETIDNFKRAVTAKVLVRNTEEELKASYFRTPDNLKKTHGLMLNYLKLSREYCELLEQVLMRRAMSQGVPDNLETIKTTRAKSLEALQSVCEELQVYVDQMKNRSADLETWAVDMERFAKENLKEDMTKFIRRKKSNP
jgi:hypothetical protein